MGMHTLRLEVWRVLHVAADIEVAVVLLNDLLEVHETIVLRNLSRARSS